MPSRACRFDVFYDRLRGELLLTKQLDHTGQVLGTKPAVLGFGVRATYACRKWAKIFEAIEGTGSDSLLRALQAKEFAKTREK